MATDSAAVSTSAAAVPTAPDSASPAAAASARSVSAAVERAAETEAVPAAATAAPGLHYSGRALRCAQQHQLPAPGSSTLQPGPKP